MPVSSRTGSAPAKEAFRRALDETYGTIGAVIILLTWMYLTMLVILAGGELNSELHHGTGSTRPRRNATYEGRVIDAFYVRDHELNERLRQAGVVADPPARRALDRALELEPRTAGRWGRAVV